MGNGKFLFMCLMMLFIGEAFMQTGVHCPTYQKDVAIREGLLTDRAICRSQSLPYYSFICLNGEKSDWFYCSTEGCNIFGNNCEGHCLTGDDFIYGETDFYLTCDVNFEVRKLCNYYAQSDCTASYYSPNLDKLCPKLKENCKKGEYVDKDWKYFFIIE